MAGFVFVGFASGLCGLGFILSIRFKTSSCSLLAASRLVVKLYPPYFFPAKRGERLVFCVELNGPDHHHSGVSCVSTPDSRLEVRDRPSFPKEPAPASAGWRSRKTGDPAPSIRANLPTPFHKGPEQKPFRVQSGGFCASGLTRISFSIRIIRTVRTWYAHRNADQRLCSQSGCEFSAQLPPCHPTLIPATNMVRQVYKWGHIPRICLGRGSRQASSRLKKLAQKSEAMPLFSQSP